MTSMKRIPRDLVALGLATVATAVLGVLSRAPDAVAPPAIPEHVARAEAAFYLGETAGSAHLRDRHWRVAAGPHTAWIDASTGELVEIQFGPR
jgi:hypothetical protein